MKARKNKSRRKVTAIRSTCLPKATKKMFLPQMNGRIITIKKL